MARRTRTKIDPLLKSYIQEEARNYREATWRQIAAKVRRNHPAVAGKPLPKARAIQIIARNARKEPGPYLDNPWSLGVSALFNIPPEATGDLLAVWKESLTGIHKFTIRQAIWVARLRAALPGAGPELLLRWATLYERRERTAPAQGKPLDTTDLDGELAFQTQRSSFHNWEYDAAVLTGNIPLSEGHRGRWHIVGVPSDVLKRGSMEWVSNKLRPYLTLAR